jgi:hypothetical protein
MARRSFEDLLDDFPRAHLVVGHVESFKATATAEKAVSRLIESLGPKGRLGGRGNHQILACPSSAVSVSGRPCHPSQPAVALGPERQPSWFSEIL